MRICYRLLPSGTKLISSVAERALREIEIGRAQGLILFALCKSLWYSQLIFEVFLINARHARK
ncbi:hypothetical protein PILCRDRAFT_339511 [Piloderma croceum F 1598]|uniref:Uncharacterized protein n=1 Tax=Piloderma croceum (strain F 1598) TaxID=765440 RepID=A0A0C3FP44_PILCF|nr:hypothetical protein PILCRDRAFT_339511 [Piloderma croceum F 1598]